MGCGFGPADGTTHPDLSKRKHHNKSLDNFVPSCPSAVHGSFIVNPLNTMFFQIPKSVPSSILKSVLQIEYHYKHTTYNKAQPKTPHYPKIPKISHTIKLFKPTTTTHTQQSPWSQARDGWVTKCNPKLWRLH